MSSPAHADPNSGLLKSEPAMAGAVAAWLLTNAGLIVVHFHLLGTTQWSSLSELVASPLSALLLGGIGWAVRFSVAPRHKLEAALAALEVARASQVVLPAAAAAGGPAAAPAADPAAELLAHAEATWPAPVPAQPAASVYDPALTPLAPATTP